MSAMGILRATKLLIAATWAAALVIIGVWLWPIDTRLATCWIAAGQCVAMWLIADDLFPGALPGVSRFFKLTAALVFVTHLLTIGYLFFWAG